MKRILLTIALFLAATPAWSADEDLDITCAAATLVEMTQLPRESSDWFSVAMTHMFFMGRLSGRNENIDWPKVVFNRAPTVRTNPNLVELNSTCQDMVIALTPIPH